MPTTDKQTEAERLMLQALREIEVNLRKPDHAGDIDPDAAKRGRSVPLAYADNTCACSEHRQLRRVWRAIRAAESAGIRES